MPKCESRGAVRVVMALVAALVAPCLDAAPVSAPELKAAFLFNFARFTEWPADVVPAQAPISLCVVGDPELAQSLSRAMQGKVIDGHPLVFARTADDAALRRCQLVYAGGIDERRARQLLEAVKDIPVLTVSDLAVFTEIGGTARLFMEGDRMRIVVNVDAAQRARLRISAQLLNLAKIVKDDHGASQ